MLRHSDRHLIGPSSSLECCISSQRCCRNSEGCSLGWCSSSLGWHSSSNTLRNMSRAIALGVTFLEAWLTEHVTTVGAVQFHRWLIALAALCRCRCRCRKICSRNWRNGCCKTTVSRSDANRSKKKKKNCCFEESVFISRRKKRKKGGIRNRR